MNDVRDAFSEKFDKKTSQKSCELTKQKGFPRGRPLF